MISVIFNQGIMIQDIVEKPIDRDFVMVRPEKVLISFIENSIYLGVLWVKPWRIIGSIGTGKIEAVGLDVDSSLNGKKVLIMPFSKKYGGIGTEIDGLLSETAVIPDDSIFEIPSDYEDKILLYPFASIATQIAERYKGERVLIIGSGITSILTHLALTPYSEVNIFTDIQIPKELGITPIKNPEKKWDVVVVATMRSWARYAAEKLITDNGTVVIPTFMSSWPPACPKNSVKIYPEKVQGALQLLDKIPEKIFNILIGYSDDIMSSIPTSKNGVIVEVNKAIPVTL
ncbi:alcohol dehydrogenase [Candidatus Acidianus copahuensis]|uniref:Alcohol dehydrogenase n=1 Tax=Candidatus Acidianus copahuensis TaxID=1160895 RepID=A0A031LLU5_9CREN|nr:alcohol dehydrogenase [Candidatus Acidianus copahuensis]EZQ03187.1 alcohol dehydrogenase [Candidatus Acidianus copahuensis]